MILQPRTVLWHDPLPTLRVMLIIHSAPRDPRAVCPDTSGL